MKHIILMTTMFLTIVNLNAQNTSSIKDMLQGKWQSIDDKTNFLVFESNQRKEIIKGLDKWETEEFILSNKCLNESDKDNGIEPEKDKYISCKESDLCWYIVNINKELLTLSYVGRGNALTYKKVKEANLTAPSKAVMIGSWTGEMSGKKLTIVIDKINNNELSGYNILGTNKRNLKGTFTEAIWDQSCSKAFNAILNEPGDDQWDGVFTVKFVGYEDQDETENGIECKGNLSGKEAIGQWKSNNGKMKKEFNLTQQ